MPDGLYDRDILLWSEQHADRLRRMAAGERVNDVDWLHLIEEVEAIGRSEQRAVESLLIRAMQHLLKIIAWPEHTAREHWRNEVAAFLGDAQHAYTPSMRQRIDVGVLWLHARRSVLQMTMDEQRPGATPADCPYRLDDLLDPAAAVDDLLARRLP
jgi:hypothetical protein